MKKDGVNLWQKWDWIALSIILVIALAARMYQFTMPLGDHHSWRQADTAAVGRNFARDGFDLLHPRYDDLSNIQSGLDNPHGYRFVEFPLYNAMFAGLYKAIPAVPVEQWGRAVTILFSLITLSIIYYLLTKESGRLAAIIGASVFAIFPFFVFYSRVVLPDPTAISLMFISILFMYLYARAVTVPRSIILFLLSTLFFALALLVKPTVVFYGIAHGYLLYRRHNLAFLTKPWTYGFFILAALPFMWWRYYIAQYPEGIPVSSWLITSVNTFQGQQEIFMKPAFFRWVFYERINNLILGGLATTFFFIGIFSRSRRYLFHSLLAGSFCYLMVFQGGNVQHDYYQIMILPTLAIFVGLGVQFLIENKKRLITPIVIYPLILFMFGMSVYVSFYQMKDYYNYSAELLQIAGIIKTLTPADAKVVTDSEGDTTLLYMADRRGSPAPYRDLQELKKSGYSYFMTQKRDVIDQIKGEHKFSVRFENDKFALFEL